MSLASTRWRLGMLLTALQCVGRPHRRQQCRHLEPRSKRSLGPQRGVPQTWDALAWWLTLILQAQPKRPALWVPSLTPASPIL